MRGERGHDFDEALTVLVDKCAARRHIDVRQESGPFRRARLESLAWARGASCTKGRLSCFACALAPPSSAASCSQLRSAKCQARPRPRRTVHPNLRRRALEDKRYRTFGKGSVDVRKRRTVINHCRDFSFLVVLDKGI